MKERGDRWNAGAGSQAKGWSWQGNDEGLADEIKFLDQANFGEVRDLKLVDCFDRFPRRA